MCRMFGFRSSLPATPHRSLLHAENALAEQSHQHPDGWGIGWYVEDDAYVIKSANAAFASERYRRASALLTSQTFVVHVRRATVGVLDHLNAHPFRFARWLMCHNGTIPSFEKVKPWLLERTDSLFLPLILGDTDSEHLFYYLLTKIIHAGQSRSGREISNAVVVGESVRQALFELDQAALKMGLERPMCNIVLTDGRLMIGHRAGMPLFLSTQKITCPDAETCPASSKVCLAAVRPDEPVNHLLIATEGIGVAENIWEEVIDGSTVVLDESFKLTILPAPSTWIAPVLPERFRLKAS